MIQSFLQYFINRSENVNSKNRSTKLYLELVNNGGLRHFVNQPLRKFFVLYAELTDPAVCLLVNGVEQLQRVSIGLFQAVLKCSHIQL